MLVFQLARNVRAAIERQLVSEGITSRQAQLALLLHSWSRKETSPHQVAGRLGTDNAGMTRLLDRLEAKGLIVRRDSPTDRRSIAIGLTKAGRELAPRVAPAFRRVHESLLVGFSDGEVEQLTALLARLAENARNLGAEPQSDTRARIPFWRRRLET